MTKLLHCSDCGLEKPSVLFGWNARRHARNAHCKACGRARQAARSYRPSASLAAYRRPKLDMSILDK